MKPPVYLLWLEGVHPASLPTVSPLMELAARGVDLHLAPLPLVEKGQCYYQAMTGMGPGKFGRFDVVRPDGYRAQEQAGVPEGALGRLLPDMLRKRKLSVTSLEITDIDALGILASLGKALDLALIRFSATATLKPGSLDALIQHCQTMIGPEAHLLVLTDVYSPPVKARVNINDFLADEGLLEVQKPRSQASILWPETLAYALGTGQIWVNLRGREPQGIVGSGREYQEVCNALVRELQTNWRDPLTREPIVDQVFRKEDIYSGEYLFNAPDLVVSFRPGYAASEKSVNLDLDGESVSYSEQAVHSVNGHDQPQPAYARLIGAGPALAGGFSGKARLIDIVPNVLYLLGLTIPQRIDGEVISSLFTQSYQSQTPVRRVEDDEDQLSDEEEGLIVNRLRDLGYLG